MNYDELKPGPELDRLVAEKVLGNPIIWRRGLSTNIAAAWQVVERFSADHVTITKYKDGEYDCEVGIGVGFWGHANTAPHAICIAALKAMDSSDDRR